MEPNLFKLNEDKLKVSYFNFRKLMLVLSSF